MGTNHEKIEVKLCIEKIMYFITSRGILHTKVRQFDFYKSGNPEKS